jgi:hypothetical protein
MDKFHINWDNFEGIGKDKRIPLKGNEHRITRVAFDLVRFNDNTSEELWQIQSSDDGEFLVRTYNLPEDKIVSESDWTVNLDKSGENITVAYKNMPIQRFASKQFGAEDLSEALLLRRTIRKKLALDQGFVDSFVKSLPENKQEILIGLINVPSIKKPVVAAQEENKDTVNEKFPLDADEAVEKGEFGPQHWEPEIDEAEVKSKTGYKELDRNSADDMYQLARLCYVKQPKWVEEELTIPKSAIKDIFNEGHNLIIRVFTKGRKDGTFWIF